MDPPDRDLLKTIPIFRVNSSSVSPKEAAIVDEAVLRIVVNNESAVEIVCSPGQPQELATGLLYTQGLINRAEDILAYEYDPCAHLCKFTLRPDGADQEDRGGSGRDLVLEAESIGRLMALHNRHSELFRETGAVHSAGLTDGRQMLGFFEDISRHNALDKLAGHILMNRMERSDKVITLTCRMSLEIIHKIIRMGIPMVVSNAAATFSAVELARKKGLTMVGFARGEQFDLYTHPARVQAKGLSLEAAQGAVFSRP